MVPAINLLPWREWRRDRLRSEFLVRVGLASGLGLVLVVGTSLYIDGRAGVQHGRNQFLRDQIAQQEMHIRQIGELRASRQQLLVRMQAIAGLQGHRPIIVRLFDEIVRTLAPGVYYSRLTLQGNRLEVVGTAESNDGISTLMRNLNDSRWLARPNLQSITGNPAFGPLASDFEMTCERRLPGGGDPAGGGEPAGGSSL